MFLLCFLDILYSVLFLSLLLCFLLIYYCDSYCVSYCESAERLGYEAFVYSAVRQDIFSSAVLISAVLLFEQLKTNKQSPGKQPRKKLLNLLTDTFFCPGSFVY